jgi:Tfp pilus assembly protein PilF
MIYLLRAAAYIEVNSYDLALIDCNTSIEIAPLDGNAYYLRSIIYEALGEYDKSSVDMQIANKLGYSEENIYNQEVGP